MKFLPVIGRILFTAPLLVFGFAHLGNAQMMVDNGMVPSFLPMPITIVYLTGVLIILCGGAIAVGYKTKPAALIIALFLLSTTFLVWAPKMASAGPDELEFMGFFMRDLGLAGAALFFAHFGAGPMSMDNKSVNGG
ncbi:MAG: DoxX family protein [Bacteroidetes bacterium]|nr:DoxX family protein [Bacteroidota bacterium]